MGFFADTKAMKDIQRIKAGGTAKLSISQITLFVVNLPDAQKRLSKKEFESVYALFKELRKCNTKIEMDMSGYLETAKSIILRFDAIAPYEKYSGGNELEYSFMMDDIRKESYQPEIFQMPKPQKIVLSDEDRIYMKHLIVNSPILLSREDAEDVIKVLHHYNDYGKEEARREYESVADKIFERESESGIAIMKISYLSGIMYPNGVLTKEESDDFSMKYILRLKKNRMENT